MTAEDGEERFVVVTVDNRYVRSNKSELCVTKLAERIEPKKFETTPAVVRRSYGVTLNQGNYESSRVDVSVEVPCYLQDVALADEWAAKFCEARLADEIRGLRGVKAQAKPTGI